MKPKFTSVTAAIIVIWIAVMLIGVFAPNLQIIKTGGTELTVPVGAICAPFFAAIATVFVAFWVSETGDSPLAGRDHSLCWSIADADPQDPVSPIRPLADRCVFNLLWTSFPHVPRSPGRMGTGVR